MLTVFLRWLLDRVGTVKQSREPILISSNLFGEVSLCGNGSVSSGSLDLMERGASDSVTGESDDNSSVSMFLWSFLGLEDLKLII